MNNFFLTSPVPLLSDYHYGHIKLKLELYYYIDEEGTTVYIKPMPCPFTVFYAL